MKLSAILLTLIPAVVAVCQPNLNTDLATCINWCQLRYPNNPGTTCVPYACSTCV
ncbi:hypothetical protein HRS9122_05991, partial [Pyrenophora teres f. teres]